MDKLKNKKIGLLAILLVFLIIVIGFIVYQAKTSKNSNNQEQNSNTIVDNSVSNEVSDEIQIPKQDKKVSKKEKKIISKYFKGIWMLQNGEKILVIDSGKRFCCIDVNNNTKEYGTYSVLDETAASVPKIILEYSSGNNVKLFRIQNNYSFLETGDTTERYVEHEGYYFGLVKSDAGVFSK